MSLGAVFILLCVTKMLERLGTCEGLVARFPASLLLSSLSIVWLVQFGFWSTLIPQDVDGRGLGNSAIECQG